MSISGIGGMGGSGGNGPEDDNGNERSADSIWGNISRNPDEWTAEDFGKAREALGDLLGEREVETNSAKQDVLDDMIVDAKDWIRRYCERTGEAVPDNAKVGSDDSDKNGNE